MKRRVINETENVNVLNTFLGVDNVEILKQRIIDLICNQLQEEFEDYTDWIVISPEDLAEEICDEVKSEVKKKIVPILTEKCLSDAKKKLGLE